ncbi:CAP domain-containing protein [Phaeosphaeriaceae sp. PMI808]|nr:CAP domain-containing protein [Phaeosphaeriaceae sp. PMI808]
MFFQLAAPLLLVLFSTSISAQSNQTASPQYTDDETFRDALLSATNTYRRQHNSSSLVWNGTLADVARKWSEGCKFEHSGGAYGENLASGYPNASASVIAWGHERVDYDFRSGDFSAATGHFTQLVWKATQQVGCGRTHCNAGQPNGQGNAPGWYVVCEYFPGGNVIGSFVDNVQDAMPKNQMPPGPADPQVPDRDKEGGVDRNQISRWVLGLGLSLIILMI